MCAGRALEQGSDKLKKDELTVLKLLQFIGAMSGGKTVTQVALAYLMAKGAHALSAPVFAVISGRHMLA